MMRLIPIALALAALLAPAAGSPQARAAGVRDGAGLFSEAAVRKADDTLQSLRRDRKWDVVVETIRSLEGDPIRERALANAKALNVHGLYILMARDDHKYFLEPSRSAQAVFTAEKVKAISDTIGDAFKHKEFDKGLLDAVAEIARDAGGAASGVRDEARLFSSDAVRKAGEELEALRRDKGWQAVIETVDSLHGQPIQARAISNAKALNVHGLYVLISKDPPKVWVEPSRSALQAFPTAKTNAIVRVIEKDFRAKEFDKGLLDAIGEIRREGTAASKGMAVAEGPPASAPVGGETSKDPLFGGPAPAAQPGRDAPPAGGAAPGINVPLLIGLGGAALVVLWLISRAFRRPSPAPSAPPQGVAPGYAPRGPAGAAPAPAPGYGPRGAAPGGAPPPGYGPAPGYPAGGGYGAPPPAPAGGGGGGFMSGMLGGLGGAVVGNILYDKFGRPHEHGEHSHPAPGAGHAGAVPPMPPHAGGSTTPAESYDPNAGAGGDWAGAETAAAAAGAGGDWGDPQPEAPAGGEGWDQAAGAGGDWGSEPVAEQDDAGVAGDWGAEESPGQADDYGAEDPGAGGDWGDAGGGGGDWGGDAGGGDADRGGEW